MDIAPSFSRVQARRHMKSILLLLMAFVIAMSTPAAETGFTPHSVTIKLKGDYRPLTALDKQAVEFLKAKDPTFDREKQEMQVFIEPESDKNCIRLSYSSGLGKTAWLVYFAKDGKIESFHKGIQSEGND